MRYHCTNVKTWKMHTRHPVVYPTYTRKKACSHVEPEGGFVIKSAVAILITVDADHDRWLRSAQMTTC